MYLKISGQANKVDKKLIRQAVKYYAEYLMPVKILRDLDLVISIEPDFRRDNQSMAECVNETTVGASREFTIIIDADLRKRDFLLTLAHELVHVKQYAKRELTYNQKLKSHRFDKKYYGKDYFYYERPWEIEAFGRELGLYNMFMEKVRTVNAKSSRVN